MVYTNTLIPAKSAFNLYRPNHNGCGAWTCLKKDDLPGDSRSQHITLNELRRILPFTVLRQMLQSCGSCK